MCVGSLMREGALNPSPVNERGLNFNPTRSRRVLTNNIAFYVNNRYVGLRLFLRHGLENVFHSSLVMC
uniref:Uncharacterized protein n=1 Tax=Pararge aegeria TaxID=116150 RepID=S4P5C2_9NEOP